MFAERQAKYPKGTYRVITWLQDGRLVCNLSNLCTGRISNAGSLWELIKDIENDINTNKYPQSGMQYRSWGSGKADGGQTGGKVLQLSGKNDPPAPPENGSTFLIKVLFRQNATWQGTIQWVEGRQTRQYRSVNELMRLLDEAADTSREQTDKDTD